MAEEQIPVGLRTCSVHPSRRFDLASLELMRDAGFQLVELSFNRPAHGVVHDDRALAASFRRRAEAWGMTLLAHAPDAYWLSNPDQSALRETITAAQHVLEGVAAYGAVGMVIHCCPGKPLLPGREAEQLDALVDALQSLAPKCEDTGVFLAAETMVPGRLTSSIENLVAAIDRVDSPWIRICLDTNHTNLGQDLSDAVRLAGSRITEFHINDNHLVREEHLLPYEGAIDWPAFAEAVDSIGFNGYMIMEPGAPYGDDVDLLPRARRAADRLLAEFIRARSAGPRARPPR